MHLMSCFLFKYPRRWMSSKPLQSYQAKVDGWVGVFVPSFSIQIPVAGRTLFHLTGNLLSSATTLAGRTSWPARMYPSLVKSATWLSESISRTLSRM